MKRTLSLVLAATASVLLAGCLPQQAQWSGNETMKRNTVELVRVAHDVRFDGTSDTLSEREAARLDAFLSARKTGPSDRLFIDLPDAENDEEAISDVNEDSRARSIVAHLSEQGHAVYGRPLPHGAAPDADTVRLVVERHVVVPPGCPDWRQPGNRNYENAPSSNWGCANVTALGLMVADPRDLVEGRDYEAADATAAADAVKRYREGDVKWEETGDSQLKEGLRD